MFLFPGTEESVSLDFRCLLRSSVLLQLVLRPPIRQRKARQAPTAPTKVRFGHFTLVDWIKRTLALLFIC